ncbi:MAG: SAM-dependent chlorinase/fluorinase [Chromatiales bacterium]|jgi:S-adenosylmethionine hydrolase|nr:SAM-dependent chlorinase/fluorinase [Chromatiales bacterium]MDX9765870.1 SAM-dependent chlorinase/fluorinase [Ectothiorhodospiraceae bacterium]
MIVLYTDFGLEGPYIGQIHAVLAWVAPGVPVINLMADAPACEPQLAGYLLNALVDRFPAGTTFLCVVDPGVGTDRVPLMAHADDRWYVGPDNGLLNPLLLAATQVETFRIDWHPPGLSASFHGRDLFAPVAARLARGEMPEASPYDIPGLSRAAWPEDLARIIYVDHFGNAMTGLRCCAMRPTSRLRIAGRELAWRRVFGEAAVGEAFWYCNANGLVEIAVNRGRADHCLGIGLGDQLEVVD